MSTITNCTCEHVAVEKPTRCKKCGGWKVKVDDNITPLTYELATLGAISREAVTWRACGEHYCNFNL